MGVEEEAIEESVIIWRHKRDEVCGEHLENIAWIKPERGENYALNHLLLICFHFLKPKDVPRGLDEGEEGQLDGQCIGSQWPVLAELYPSRIPVNCLFDLKGKPNLEHFRDSRDNSHHME